MFANNILFYFLTKVDEFSLVLYNSNNYISSSIFDRGDVKYTIYKTIYLLRYKDPNPVVKYMVRVFDKYAKSDIPFQLPNIFCYYYDQFVSFYFQMDYSGFYKYLFWTLFILNVLYLFSKLSGYVNSYYFATYASIFRQWRWFVSDVNLMNSARIAVLVNLISSYYILSLLFFIGFYFFIINLDSILLFIYNNSMRYPLSSRAGGNNFWLNTLDLNQVLSQINLTNAKFKYVSSYKGIGQDLSLPLPSNVSLQSIEKFFIDNNHKFMKINNDTPSVKVLDAIRRHLFFKRRAFKAYIESDSFFN